jgi:hypothetical protein
MKLQISPRRSSPSTTNGRIGGTPPSIEGEAISNGVGSLN